MSSPTPCCSSGDHAEYGYLADKSRYVTRMRRIEGQVRGIQKMVEDEKYCIDILTQIAAVQSALENVGLSILEDHLSHCVADAAAHGGTLADDKLAEAMNAIRRMVKS
ncbi:metal-sensitive transcriptional regulator [Corynebacterium uropygiale]|nr:metal-sensitive transcriptional regulator [Corynebacterium uropygiale]